MAKSCETCKHASNDHYECETKCDEHYSGWEPKREGTKPPAGVFIYGETLAEKHVKSCETCGFLKDGFLCGLDGADIRVVRCETDKWWKPKDGRSDTQKKISEMCDEIKTILLEKNRKYGDSAINPKRVFSKASPIEQINVRIDDKISRIMSAQDDDTEDAELDLIGYLILKRVAKSVGEGK